MASITKEAVEAALGQLREATQTEIANIRAGLQGAETKLNEFLNKMGTQSDNTAKELENIVAKLGLMESQQTTAISELQKKVAELKDDQDQSKASLSGQAGALAWLSTTSRMSWLTSRRSFNNMPLHKGIYMK